MFGGSRPIPRRNFLDGDDNFALTPHSERPMISWGRLDLDGGFWLQM